MLDVLHEREISVTARNEGRAEGRNEGRTEGRSEMLNTLIELMRANGISNEQISTIREAALKS